MIETPKILTLSPQKVAKIHQVVPRSQIQQAMGKLFAELNAALKAQGIGITGPWFTHHLKRPGENFDFEICFPVNTVVQTAGRVQPGERPAIEVARTVYQGPYDKLGQAWHEFHEWLQANGHKASADFYESYLVGPESSPNPADWRTELTQQVIK